VNGLKVAYNKALSHRVFCHACLFSKSINFRLKFKRSDYALTSMEFVYFVNSFRQELRTIKSLSFVYKALVFDRHRKG